MKDGIYRRDKGKERILNIFKEMQNVYITAGIHKDEKPYPGGTSVAYIAAILEKGSKSKNIPPRPFLKNTLKSNKAQYYNMLKENTLDVMKFGGTLDKGLKEVGSNMANDIQNAIYTKRKPPNAPSTVRQKGKNDPLVDSKRLVKSIAYKVENL